MSSTLASSRSAVALSDSKISFLHKKISNIRASLADFETIPGSRSAAAQMDCNTQTNHSIVSPHLYFLTSTPPSPPTPPPQPFPISQSPAASSEEQLLNEEEVAKRKMEIEAIQQQLFVSALVDIEAEVTSPEFRAAFDAATSGVGIESYRKMNDLPLDAQVKAAVSVSTATPLTLPPCSPFSPTT